MASPFALGALHEFFTAAIDLDSHTLKLALMVSGFSFNPVTHTDWADVSASALAFGNGYSAHATLATPSFNDTYMDEASILTFATVSITASGGAFGPTPGAIIYDDSHASKAVIGYTSFGENQTIQNGDTFEISFVRFSLMANIP